MRVPLTRGLSAHVDPEDLPLVAGLSWWASPQDGGKWRALASAGGRKSKKTLYMHRIIAGAGPGDVVDHIDGDPLNNRRANLRVTGHQQNQRNRSGPDRGSASGILGVCPKRGRWRAYLTVDGKQVNLGTFLTLEEAAEARRVAELKHWGENSAYYRNQRLGAPLEGAL